MGPKDWVLTTIGEGLCAAPEGFAWGEPKRLNIGADADGVRKWEVVEAGAARLWSYEY